MGRPAVFLDRDGVVNENRADYVKRWVEVVFLPGAFAALRRLAETEFAIVLITNQSAVGRGIISHDEALEINGRVVQAIHAHGGRVDGAYLCPHHPDASCACRKPRPGLLLRAAAELGLDLERSVLVGDALSDVEAARAVGVHAILVLTGRGTTEARRMDSGEPVPCLVVDDLGAAVDYILGSKT